MWLGSGAAKAYAAAHGLNAGTFAWWRRRRHAAAKRHAAPVAQIAMVRVGRVENGAFARVRTDGQVTITFAALGAVVTCEGHGEGQAVAHVLATLAQLARAA